MSTRIPLTIHGNLTIDPKTGIDREGKAWTQFSVAVQDRRWNKDSQVWEDGQTVFHDVVVFGRQAEHAVASLRKGQAVLVDGELKFGSYVDENEQRHETRQIVADYVGASLAYNAVEVQPRPKAEGPVMQQGTTGPVAVPAATGSSSLTR